MKWSDRLEIALALEEKFPDTEILKLRFTELRQMVISLDGFADDANASNEKYLEAIQMTWLDERGEDTGGWRP